MCMGVAIPWMKAKIRPSDNCPFCNEKDDLVHIFIECQRLHTLFDVFNITLNHLYENQRIPLTWYIHGPPRTKRTTPARRLLHYIISSVKKAIHLTRINKLNDSPQTDALLCFKARLRSRIENDFKFHVLNRTLATFTNEWCTNDALATIHDELLVFPDHLI